MLLEEIFKDQKSMSMGDGNLYQIVINEELTVHLRSFFEDRYFYLYAKVGELPEGEARTELLETLLEANLFSQECNGAFFSWHKQSNTLVLMTSFDSTVATYQQYTSTLQPFVEYVVHWKKKLEELPSHLEKEDRMKLLSQNKKIFFT